MEYLNRIQIRGTVGAVRLNEIHGTKVASLSVATEYLKQMPGGSPACEVTWHNVVYWPRENADSLENIDRGTAVYVEGRMRSTQYTSASGEMKNFYEIIASRLEVVK